jgi:adenylate cyclase
MSFVVEAEMRYRVSAGLLDTYVGQRTGRRVLSGAIRRGMGETIPAVVWFSDLRGFAALAGALSNDALLDLLNAYFEAVGRAVTDAGGEVLKFLGDGMLAIFEIGDIADARAQCLAALDAAAAARDAIAALNRERGEAPEIRWGLALDLGEVYYGNVGTPDRLDFTVIGKAVNLASRLEAIAADIGEPVVASQAFADASGVPMRDLGYHKVKGFEAPQAAFAPER